MSKRADIVITSLFLLVFGFYTLLGFAFGGMGGENHSPYILATTVGLMFLIGSLTVRSVNGLIWTRILGLILVPSLIYFDVRSRYTFEAFWSDFFSILTYFPTLVFISYVTSSIMRIRSVTQLNSG
jgi:hypothetical protein